MTQQARVVRENGVLYAEIIRSEACQKCRMCDFGKKERLLQPLPKGNFCEGDTVTIELEDRKLTKAAFLAYGMPLLLCIAGLVAGFYVFSNELLQAATALVFTLAGLVYLARSEKRRRQRGTYECKTFRQED